MATIVLAAAGAAVGGSVGGTLAGLSAVAAGRLAGATLGSVIDQKLLGAGSDAVETGRIDRFRLSNSADGATVTEVYGRMRVGGQIIWASDFREEATTSGGGGKGAPSQPTTTRYSYSVSLAVAVCAGEITSISRVWADGEEIGREDLNLRVYPGSRDQQPDPVIEAIEGEGRVPAYRGTAYVVMEDLALERFGNRVPQFSFEVVRAEQPEALDFVEDLGQLVQGVALIPGTGEYALATSPVYMGASSGPQRAANLNSPSGQTDFVTAIDRLTEEIPVCGATSLVVSWFGDDLRCGSCTLRPKVERREEEAPSMPWSVSGLARAAAGEIAQVDGRPIYGGTPADASVVEAIRHLRASGQRVMFYPFILMEQQVGNGLEDPWTGNPDQPHLPWRGRITTSVAPNRNGSPDGTGIADMEVAAFFGTAQPTDFEVLDGAVRYTGPEEWTMRRFILHYAALCAAAGGVDAFCIGSEMRSLTQIRGAAGFPSVEAFRSLAVDVRSLLGAGAQIGYAADWSEYFGYAPQDGSGDRYFHLDPLWADPAIDFVGIDNYMPLADWRDGQDHADAEAGSIYAAEYLRGNVEGGEGYDWYYHSPEAEAAQIRTPITDGANDEPWIWRFKDLRNWWSQPHHERIAGERQASPTGWEPASKPIWFTEVGCPAVDKGANQPNVFVDPKSSESRLPRASSGARDDLIQRAYLQAMLGYWAEPERNPVSEVYGGPMIDLANAYVWAWDTRPFPSFPNAREVWSDGPNYALGHWISGRVGSRTLASVVREICHAAGVVDIDVTGLHGTVTGYVVEEIAEARAALQPLMLRYGFDAIERDGVLRFVMRGPGAVTSLSASDLAETSEVDGRLALRRDAEAEMTGRVRLRFLRSGSDYEAAAEEAVLPNEATHAVAGRDLALSMSRAEARQVAERWLVEAQLARDTARFALPPSRMALGAGDLVTLPDMDQALYRIDRVEQADLQLIEAVRIEPSLYTPAPLDDEPPGQRAFAAPVPVLPVFLDLPLLRGDEVEHAPYVAATAQPWPGTVAVYVSGSDEDYQLERVLADRAIIGLTESAMRAAPSGRWDGGAPLQVRLTAGTLESKSRAAVLTGANLAAIGDGTSGNWELFQFAQADIIGSDTWLLSDRLRGQAGSDALIPDVWPAGSLFVLMNGVPEQIDLAATQRRLARHFRIGPGLRGYEDPSYVHRIEAFDGNGLRPYSPCHLRRSGGLGEDVRLSWIRRTRIDGDDWDLPEVPLGEEREAYLVRVMRADTVLREVEVTRPHWTYPIAAQAVDGADATMRISVAQISARFGPGPAAEMTF
jgi:hypothetical protein